MLDVMLDLETMGTAPMAPIIAIGAVLFDAKAGTLGESFYTAVNLESAVQAGAVLDPATVLWWLRQSDEARAAVTRDDALHLSAALLMFCQWIDKHSDASTVRMWGNGASFDNTILAQAYRMAQLAAPWRYYNDRCYRTLKALHPDVPVERTGTHHHALHDAQTQARHAIALLTPKNAPQHPDPFVMND